MEELYLNHHSACWNISSSPGTQLYAAFSPKCMDCWFMRHFPLPLNYDSQTNLICWFMAQKKD